MKHNTITQNSQITQKLNSSQKTQKTKQTTKTNNTKQSQWKFQDSDTITQILDEENHQYKSKETQSVCILRKINIAIINYLLTQTNKSNKTNKLNKSNKYFFEFKPNNKNIFNENNFLFVNKIYHKNKIIFDCESDKELYKKSYTSYYHRYRRKIQMQKLVELLQKESGMKMTFDYSLNCLQLISFVDKNDKLIDLIQFLNKYENTETIKHLMMKENNEESNENKMEEETMIEWKFQNE